MVMGDPQAHVHRQLPVLAAVVIGAGYHHVAPAAQGVSQKPASHILTASGVLPFTQEDFIIDKPTAETLTRGYGET